jgi:hypothetical protein
MPPALLVDILFVLVSCVGFIMQHREPTINFSFFSYLSRMNGNNIWFLFYFRHIYMYPLGDQYSTNSLSLYLYLQDQKKLPLESGMMIELTVSILDQNHGKHYTVTGSALHTCT